MRGSVWTSACHCWLRTSAKPTQYPPDGFGPTRTNTRLTSFSARPDTVTSVPESLIATLSNEPRSDTSLRAVGVKVVDVDSAFVGLYNRAVVFVLAKALAFLDVEELTALVAHEMSVELR